MKRGFTLIELLVVVALIAIVSTLAVTRIGDTKKVASRKVSIANQQSVGRAMDAYMALNGGRIPNRFDSLIDMETPIGSGGGFDFSSVTVDNKVGYLYNGPDDVASVAQLRDQNSGLESGLKSVLVPYSLSEAEARGLSDYGLKFLMRHTTSALESPRAKYGDRGDDGEILVDDAEIGLRPDLSACIAVNVTNRIVVAAVTPLTNAGRQIYRDFGIELPLREEEDSGYAESEAVKEVKALGGPLIAFGVGDACSIVGAQVGGIEVAPFAEYPLAVYYRRYIAVFRLAPVNGRVEPVFAGVLDPCGLTIRQARSAMGGRS